MSLESISLRQSQKLQQTLAPNMRESLEILQKNLPDLIVELRTRMAANPLIEDITTAGGETPISELFPEDHADGSVSENELAFTSQGDEMGTVLSAEDGYRDYFLQNLENASSDEEAQSRRQALFDRQVKQETLQEHLLKQIENSNIAEADHPIAEILISYIDENGRFTGALPDVEMVTGASEKRLIATLTHILKFDPLGCGARDLRECLLAQLSKLDDSPWQNEVRALILRHLEDVAAGRFDLIRTALRLTRDELNQALAALRTLDPKPGRLYAADDRRPQIVKAEVHAVPTEDGSWKAIADERYVPELHLSRHYMDLIENPDTPRETKEYLRERLREAHALIDAIENRQNTIQSIAQAILDAQPDFPSKGLIGLRPLTQGQIAQTVGVNDSTVSRTVSNKYISTPRGTLELKTFFPKGLQTAGGETVSNTAVKERLEALIRAEDKSAPLADDRLAALLNAEGIAIKRRTVAKYRTALGIPGAADRRRV